MFFCLPLVLFHQFFWLYSFIHSTRPKTVVSQRLDDVRLLYNSILPNNTTHPLLRVLTIFICIYPFSHWLSQYSQPHVINDLIKNVITLLFFTFNCYFFFTAKLFSPIHPTTFNFTTSNYIVHNLPLNHHSAALLKKRPSLRNKSERITLVFVLNFSLVSIYATVIVLSSSWDFKKRIKSRIRRARITSFKSNTRHGEKDGHGALRDRLKTRLNVWRKNRKKKTP